MNSSFFSIDESTLKRLKIMDDFESLRSSSKDPKCLLRALATWGDRATRRDGLRALLRIEVEFLNRESLFEVDQQVLVNRFPELSSEINLLDRQDIFGLDEPPKSGTRVGPYLVKETKSSKGGQAHLCLATDTRLNRKVALKVSKRRAINNRLIQEAILSGSISDPFIIPIYSSGLYRELVYLAMPFFEKGALGHQAPNWLDANRLQLLQSFSRLCRTVHTMHEFGVRHNDITPWNILITAHNEFILADFGMAESLDNWTGTLLTGPVGTPPFMSPERATGEADALDTSADIFGLGATLFWFLTGRRPFQGEAASEVLENSRRSNVNPDGNRLLAKQPRVFQHICKQAMHPSVGKRLSTAAELAQAIDESLHHIANSRHRRLSYLTMATLFALCVAIAALFSGSRPSAYDASTLEPADTRIADSNEGRSNPPAWLQDIFMDQNVDPRGFSDHLGGIGIELGSDYYSSDLISKDALSTIMNKGGAYATLIPQLYFEFQSELDLPLVLQFRVFPRPWRSCLSLTGLKPPFPWTHDTYGPLEQLDFEAPGPVQWRLVPNGPNPDGYSIGPFDTSLDLSTETLQQFLDSFLRTVANNAKLESLFVWNTNGDYAELGGKWDTSITFLNDHRHAIEKVEFQPSYPSLNSAIQFSELVGEIGTQDFYLSVKSPTTLNSQIDPNLRMSARRLSEGIDPPPAIVIYWIDGTMSAYQLNAGSPALVLDSHHLLKSDSRH